ncbi:hypothetical protein DNL40_02275 [Xylanimonas oleitrophica]|uniref:Uncharacterized protein n=1 Tax=Xylanimonas oleitrophica TaxID=2607479 RepID=A0A2W5X2S3_9MICO|nr:hypothetical protein [Xylanimonas oleitrophica]PZR55216.1 hypothetical protein DNL40_02275 [Xylanimonas oleitrophica]
MTTDPTEAPALEEALAGPVRQDDAWSVCALCGAVVAVTAIHDAFHARQGDTPDIPEIEETPDGD